MASVERLSHTFLVTLSEPGTSDTAFLTYEPALSRVRVDMAKVLANLVANGTFEVDKTGWTATGGTATRDTTQAHSGSGSLRFDSTP